jgi:hypothetical protein
MLMLPGWWTAQVRYDRKLAAKMGNECLTEMETQIKLTKDGSVLLREMVST